MLSLARIMRLGWQYGRKSRTIWVILRLVLTAFANFAEGINVIPRLPTVTRTEVQMVKKDLKGRTDILDVMNMVA